MYKPDRIIHRGGYPHDADLPFDLNDPQEEDNLHEGDYFHHFQDMLPILIVYAKMCHHPCTNNMHAPSNLFARLW